MFLEVNEEHEVRRDCSEGRGILRGSWRLNYDGSPSRLQVQSMWQPGGTLKAIEARNLKKMWRSSQADHLPRLARLALCQLTLTDL